MMSEFKFFKGENIKWITMRRVAIKIENMSTNHIKYVMNCLADLGEIEIPENYYGRSKMDWFCIFQRELIKRNERI